MNVEDLSPALIAMLKEVGKQYCRDVERIKDAMIFSPVFNGTDLFKIGLGVWGPDYRDKGNGCTHIIVGCYLFEEYGELTIVDDVPKLGPRSWVIRFHPKSEIKPTGRLSVAALEQQLSDPSNEPQTDRARSNVYCELFNAWNTEVSNLKKLRIAKQTE